MPVLPASLFERLWVQFSAMLPERPRVVPTTPSGVTAGDSRIV